MSLRGKQCPVCEEWYADWATRCPVCGVALVDGRQADAAENDEAADLDGGETRAGAEPVTREDIDVAALPEEEQLVYEMAEWSLAMRAEVAAALADAGVPHVWDGMDLLVHLDDEDVVDEITERIENEFGVNSATAPASTESRVDQDEDEDWDDEFDDDDDLLEYDLARWSQRLRQNLVTALDQAGVVARLRGAALIVRAEDEAAVESAIDVVSAQSLETQEDLEADLADTSDDEAEDGSYSAMSDLFLAADRLQRDPEDGEGIRLLADTVDAIDAEDPPFGISPPAWQQVVAASEALADALAEDEVDDDAVGERARELRGILRPLI